ncbi:MAG: riboflavin synthase [Deltaproteobacteria bacterium]|nr:MAG: riboflavin synthase [Deltaproteobacteria bacterium]RLB74520.1 MAG: riboflavin synthase [Deltaproteobacteria bacterium]
MFTGLVEGIGTVKTIKRVGRDMVLSVVPPFDVSECQIGESISVDGVCLTVTDITTGTLSMDVSEESLSRTTLALLKQGDSVNLERALRPTDRLGGHIVLGHIDGVGTIIRKQPRQRSWTIRVAMDRSLTKYTVEKGSISIDGISLTINKCFPDGVEVNIIPETGRVTTLLKKGVGDKVNIETDLIGKHIEKLLAYADNMSGDRLRGWTTDHMDIFKNLDRGE